MRRTVRWLGWSLCLTLACGGGGKTRPPWWDDDLGSEEDLGIQDLGTDGAIDGVVDPGEGRDLPDGRDVRDNGRKDPGATEDPGDEDPGEGTEDLQEDRVDPGADPGDPGPGDADAGDEGGFRCNRDEECLGLLPPVACQVVRCLAGICGYEAQRNYVRCDDGDACTSSDQCLDGRCTGQPVTCDDGRLCTLDLCSSSLGCQYTVVDGECDDGNFCSVDDRCQGGECIGSLRDCRDDNPCTSDWCDSVAGECRHSPLTGAACDDGLDCTDQDRCQAGVCRGQSTCDDGNPCTDDACTPTGCRNAPRTGDCSDGDPCTLGDTCVEGRCQGAPLACDDDNSCTRDFCLGGSCRTEPLVGPCDDGDACTDGDACLNGRCQGSARICGDPPTAWCDGDTRVSYSVAGQCRDGDCLYPESRHLCSRGCQDGTCLGDPCEGVDCSVPPGPCQGPGTCREGLCEYPLADGAPCEDGDWCTVGDTCAGGTCRTGEERSCDDGNPCTADSCSSAGRACLHAAVGGLCDDGDPCTLGDHCNLGSCVGGSVDPCDDDNPCTRDGCLPGEGCRHAPTGEGLPCDDRNGCTAGDRCVQGECRGQGLDCNDGNPCTLDLCDDPQVGCYHRPRTGSCDDGDPCTEGDACVDGECRGGSLRSCDDGDPCTADRCEAGFGCVQEPASGGACSDGDPCTRNDTCVEGLCRGVPLCDDGNVCTDDRCSGGACDYVPLDGGSCDDGNDCTVNDRCSGGACRGTPLDCNDGDPCTADFCQRGQGCVHAPVSGDPCDDGNPCTLADACDQGRCRGWPMPCETPPPNVCLEDDGVIISYSQQGTCVAGECRYQRQEWVCTYGCSGTTCVGDPCEGIDCSVAPNPCYQAPGICVMGQCRYDPRNGAPCDDGDPCSVGDTCLSGTCLAGAAADCDDREACTRDSCVPGSGCRHDPIPGPCDDGDRCTTGDSCADGRCVGGPRRVCDDDNPCTTDHCDPLEGCYFRNLGDGFPCNDGNQCTRDDRCVGGRCTGDGLDCNDGNPCTDDLCDDPILGCYHRNNALPCEDGSPCTANDRCQDGTCRPGEAVSCDDGNYCTSDSCDPVQGCVHSFNALPCAEARCDGGVFYPARSCEAGRCPEPTRVFCTDAVACTRDLCTPEGCRNEPDDSLCPEDGDPCTQARCHPIRGCESVSVEGPCNDGNPCTVGDACQSGGSCAGLPYHCDDGLDCTRESCDGLGGCQVLVVEGTCLIEGQCYGAGQGNPLEPCQVCNPVRDARDWSPRGPVPCDDGDDCTLEDRCQEGSCVGVAIDCDDRNPCTDDQCVAGIGCVHAPNAGPCEDGNLCTVSDRCYQGTCVPGFLADCNDGNPCTADDCLPATGCRHLDLEIPCSDGDPCTVGDFCLSGTCRPGAQDSCDDGNPCTEDNCLAEVGGCFHVPMADGWPCDDGNGCTVGESCDGGRCVGQGPDCDDHNPCTDDRCDDLQVGCYHVPNTRPCNDGSACTRTDRCQDGQCVGADPVTCDDGNLCTDDDCDPASGCRFTPNAASCDDGNECTLGDTCFLGRCLGGSPRTCDDGNPCTQDLCLPDQGCTVLFLATPCNDGDPCTYSDRCREGACEGTPYACDDGLACTADACDGQGGCSHLIQADSCLILGACIDGGSLHPENPCRFCDPSRSWTSWSDRDGAACEDGLPCTFGDRCQGGRCQGTGYGCNDGLACTADSCDGTGGCRFEVAPGWCAIDGQCWQAGQVQPGNPCRWCAAGDPAAWSDRDGAACDDGDPCTVMDSCRGGSCAPGLPRQCDDGNVCTDDTCDPQGGGCLYTANQAVCQPASCAGLVYHPARVCGDKICQPSTLVSCDDGDPCTEDSCAPDGCHHLPVTGACDDGNPCTYGDTCATGTCQGTAYVCPVTECLSRNVCDGQGGCTPTPRPDGSACSPDTNPCTNDICQGGACGHPPKADGTACNDGNACTRNDSCQAGTCTGGSAVTCPAPDSCHLDGTCDPATGLCVPPPKGDGSPCDDGNLCTTTDQCLGGTCVGSNPRTCEAVDDCHLAGVCYPATGECTRPVKPNGAPCDDGNPCTRVDSCQAGVCTGSSPLPCPATDACHLPGVCNPATGTCSDPVAPEGTPCNDRNPCTTEDACQEGVCQGQPVVCPPPTPCHDQGICDVVSGLCTAVPKTDGASCNDGNACTSGDTCQAGVCSGTAYGCADGLLCTADACLGDGSCAYGLLPGWCLIDGVCRPDRMGHPDNQCLACLADVATEAWSSREGVPCQDNDPSTWGDTCHQGACIGTPVACDDGIPCTEDSWDGQGGCRHFLRPGFCLIDGTCHGEGAVDPSQPCQRCRTLYSNTAWTPTLEGGECDDGQSCTRDDRCLEGVCVGIPYSCDDGRSCTVDACLGTGECQHVLEPGWCLVWGQCFAANAPDPTEGCRVCDPGTTAEDFTPREDGWSCDDGNACTDGDQCIDGVCTGVGQDCNDGLPCTADSCDGQGQCLHALREGWCLIEGQCWAVGMVRPQNACLWCQPEVSDSQWTPRNGALCDDGDLCTAGETCQDGVCGGGISRDCTDDLPCTEDYCLGGTCRHGVAQGWCAIQGTCFLQGALDPGNPCNLCAPDQDALRWTYQDQAPCDDGFACTLGDRCTAGSCQGEPYSCDDALTCTADTCDGQGGCLHEVQPGFCRIGNRCLVDQEASPDTPCLVCDSGVHREAWTPRNGIPCDDRNPCTTGDVCQDGQCVGASTGCDDGLACTEDFCDPQGVCRHLVRSGWCLVSGTCVAEGTPDPGNPCRGCVPGEDQGAYSPLDGRPCDDGDTCTFGDLCQGGLCGGIPYSCDDGRSCTADSCNGDGSCRFDLLPGACLADGACWTEGQRNPANGCQECRPEVRPGDWSPLSGVACDDGNACSSGDLCTDGICAGSPYSCSDGLSCTYDVCDGQGGCANPLAETWCLIGGRCYFHGAYDPEHACRACDVTRDRYGWSVIGGGQPEVCNGVDDDCDGVADPPGTPGCQTWYRDDDGDGSGRDSDSACLCGPDGVYRASVPGDCNDGDPAMRPGGVEVCDGKDNDCDGFADPAGTMGCLVRYYDFDGDGFGKDAWKQCLCGPAGYYRALNPGDCDDADPAVYPAASEICDGKDNDCDGAVDPPGSSGCAPWYQDRDGDGYGGPTTLCRCGPGDGYTASQGGDCDEDRASVHPGAPERCNARDDDCNGAVDEGSLSALCPLDPGAVPHGTLVACTAAGRCLYQCDPRTGNQPAWYDLNESGADGCECQGDAWEHLGGEDCAHALDLGTLGDSGQSLEIVGNLVSYGDEDWFRVTVADLDPLGLLDGCDRFHARFALASNPQDTFRLEVLTAACDDQSPCRGVTAWEKRVDFYTDTLGECPCDRSYLPSCDKPASLAACLARHGTMDRCGTCPGEASPGTHRCIDNGNTFLIRVYRRPEAPATCQPYRLVLSNGIP